MTFEEAWDGLELGDRVAVSDGTPAPPESQVRRYSLWRSHNFEGALVEKADGPHRGLRIEIDKTGGARVSYTVAEWPEHEFTPA